MFDIFNFKDAQENPLLAAEFIKIVPAYELTKHLLKAYSEESDDGPTKLLVDIEAIRDGILASGRDDLQLVLATYGEVIELWETKALEQLAAKGPAFKAALFNNSRIDWYSLSLRNDEGNNILRNTLLADIEDPTNKSLLYAMVRNPRMDRSVIADAMRGLKGFEELPMETRLLIGAEAIGVKEIPAEFYAGKDTPDSHEIYFTRVNDAFISMIRDAKEALDEKKFNSYLTGLLLWKLPKAKLDVRADDWLTAEEIQTIEEKASGSEKFMDGYNRKQRAALYKVFEYFGSWYDRDDGYPQTTTLISKASVAIMSMASLMRSHSVSHDIETIVEEMLASPHLLVRAAGYATIFNNITVESNSPLVKSFFSSYPENSLEKWMGITNTTAFWLCDGYSSLWNTIREEMSGSGYDVKIESARDDMYQYLFCSGSYAERLDQHNKTTRPSLFKPKSMASRVIHTAFSVDESKIKAAQEPKGLLGKLFK
jgi:hypothetical protein